MDEERRKLVATMRHELGLDGDGERFACDSCGRAASVQRARDRLDDIILEHGFDFYAWPKMRAALDAGTDRILPGWLVIESNRWLEHEDAVGHLEQLVSLGVMNREGNGYLPAPARCADCLSESWRTHAT